MYIKAHKYFELYSEALVFLDAVTYWMWRDERKKRPTTRIA